MKHVIVHALRSGLPLCGFSSEPPVRWPGNHSFTFPTDLANITCEECRVRATETAEDKKIELPKDYLENVCRFGKGSLTCSFLAMGSEGLSCLKGHPLESIIRQRREAGTIRAKGDNCSGPPVFTIST